MQLYKVTFRAHHEDYVDTGAILVCASSKSDAEDRVIALCDIPRSKTDLDVDRIKTNHYQLSRYDYDKAVPKGALKDDVPVVRKRKEVYVLSASAAVVAISEASGWKKLIRHVNERLSRGAAFYDEEVTDVALSAYQEEESPKTADVGREAVFSHHRMFQGGAARPR